MKALLKDRREYCVRPHHLGAFALSPRHRTKPLPPGAQDAVVLLMEKFYPEDEQKQLDAVEEWVDWKGTAPQGIRASAAARYAGADWWDVFGGAWGLVRTVAQQILSLRTSVSPSERGWAAYGRITTKKRGSLKFLQKDRLVRVLYNKRYFDCPQSESYYAVAEFDAADVESEED